MKRYQILKNIVFASLIAVTFATSAKGEGDKYDVGSRISRVTIKNNGQDSIWVRDYKGELVRIYSEPTDLEKVPILDLGFTKIGEKEQLVNTCFYEQEGGGGASFL